MDFKRTTIGEAMHDLRGSEFKLWLALHELTERERLTTAGRLAKRLELSERRTQLVLNALANKGYIRIEPSERSHVKRQFTVYRRLDVSAGLFLRY